MSPLPQLPPLPPVPTSSSPKPRDSSSRSSTTSPSTDRMVQEIEQLKGLVGHLKKATREAAVTGAQTVLHFADHPAGIINRRMKFQYVNPSFCQLLGYPAETILGQRYTDILDGHSGDLHHFFRNEAEIVRQRVSVRLYSGASKSYDLTKTVVHLPAAQYFFSVFHLYLPGILESLTVTQERLELERHLAERERERQERETVALQVAEAIAKSHRDREWADRLRQAHVFADQHLRR
jgi:PAS domain-containing protein